MSTICGLRANGATYLAADRAAICGTLRAEDIQKIIALRSGWAVAVAGDARALHVVTDCVPSLNKAINEWGNGAEALTALVASEMVLDLREALRKDGFERKPGSQVLSYPVELIIASPSDLWVVRGNFAYARVPDGEVGAVGMGEAAARGAAYALGPDPATRDLSEPVAYLRTCIAAAARVHPSCGAEADVWCSAGGGDGAWL